MTVADRLAVDEDAHVFAERALVIEDVVAELRVGGEGAFKNGLHRAARAFHAGAIHMAPQVRGEMHRSHGKSVPRQNGFDQHLPPPYLMATCGCLMPKFHPRRSVLAALALWPLPALAHSARVGDIKIGHAWALPAPVGDGQVFVPLLNVGSAEDALVAARSDSAAIIELRRNARYDDPAEQAFPLPPGHPFAMRPQGRHLRLIGLAAPLVIGQRFPLILDFLNAGEAEIEVHVEQSPGT